MNSKKRSYHTLRDYFQVVFKHKALIAIVFMLSVLTAVIVCFTMEPVHESFAKLLVKNPGNPDLAAINDTASIIDTAAEMLTGRYLIERVIRQVGLRTLYPHIERASVFDQLTKIERAVLAFHENLSVKSGRIIEVRFRHRSSELAAKVVNLLIEQFLNEYLSIQKQHQKYNFFKEQANLMLEKLKASQQQLGLFRNENNISSIQKQKSLLLLQISDLSVALAKSMAEISQLETAAKKAGTTSRAERTELSALQSREKKLQQQITQYKLELGRLDKAETQLHELERTVELDEENYLLYAKKMEEARISNAMDEQNLINFSVIEPAMPPITPIKPDKPLIITLATVLGLFGGLLLAMLAEYFSHRFDNRNDIEEILACPALACIPELGKVEQAMLAGFSLPERVMDEGNRIKQFIKRTLPDARHKLLLFCSPNQLDGTTSIMLSVAKTIAAGGEQVLLVDANLRESSLHRLLQVEQQAGLAEAIIGKASVDGIIKDTDIPTLKVITSGAPQTNPFELLQSEFFCPFIEEVKTKAEWVFFDSPSLDYHNDACVIGPKLNGVVLVVRAGKTRWEVARSTMGRFRQCNAKVLGAVLNRQVQHIPPWLYERL